MNVAHARASDRYGYRRITIEAWHEWKEAKSVQGASDTLLGTARPPRAWVDDELGFGAGQGPSLQVTMLRLDAGSRIVARARRPVATTSRRESAEARSARLRRECVDALYRAARGSDEDDE